MVKSQKIASLSVYRMNPGEEKGTGWPVITGGIVDLHRWQRSCVGLPTISCPDPIQSTVLCEVPDGPNVVKSAFQCTCTVQEKYDIPVSL